MTNRTNHSLLSLGALLLTACAGDVLARGPECSSAVNTQFGISGDCSRTFETLAEESTERIGINTNDFNPSVAVGYYLEVESGAVTIAFETVSAGTVSKTATPGNPVDGTVRMVLDAFNQLKFRLTPDGGEAGGVSYQIHFECDCIP